MSGRKAGMKTKYRESEPDVTQTGIGKNYAGYRIFHTKKNNKIEHISPDYSLRGLTEEELERFKMDVAEAATKNEKVAKYLERFPNLRIKIPTESLKPEPEPIMT